MTEAEQLTRVWRLKQMGKALAQCEDPILQRKMVDQMMLEYKPKIGQSVQDLLKSDDNAQSF